jgi:hypothetical protein
MADNRSRPLVIVVAVLGVALLVAAFISEAVFHVSVDPTEQAFAVTLHNDTAGTVLIKQCASTCRSFHEQDQLAPGASVRVNTSDHDIANWWAVTDAGGAALGCLPLRYDQRVEGLVVNVSERAACPEGSFAKTSAVGAVVGFLLFLLVAAIGIASVVFATTAAHRWLARRGLRGRSAAGVTTLAALGIFLGGWLLFDFYVVARESARFVRRPSPAT